MVGEWKGMARPGLERIGTGIGSLILASFLLCCNYVNKSEHFERIYFSNFFWRISTAQ
jgi:hypothetical protein